MFTMKQLLAMSDNMNNLVDLDETLNTREYDESEIINEIESLI